MHGGNTGLVNVRTSPSSVVPRILCSHARDTKTDCSRVECCTTALSLTSLVEGVEPAIRWAHPDTAGSMEVHSR